MKKKVIQDGFNTVPLEPHREKKAAGGFKNVLVVTALVLFFLIVLIVLIRMDVGGFGSRVLRPAIKDIPVVSKILPPATDEQIASESGYESLEQAVNRIQDLEKQVQELKAQLESKNFGNEANDAALQTKIEELQTEIATLKVYEKNQKNFEATKEDFYKEVIYNDNVDVSDYTKWYESMDQDTAAKLYKEAVQTQEASATIKELASSYSKMDPVNAASVLEQMTGDLDTVVAILEEMNASQRGEIMGEMSPAFAAKITKKMTS